MQKKAKIRICDACQKEVSDDGEMRFGGSAFQGWLHLSLTDGSTQLDRLMAQKEWDFCCVNCLQDFIDKNIYRVK
jgi:hypothetical protein